MVRKLYLAADSMKNKMTAALLSLVMLLSLGACGTSDEADENKTLITDMVGRQVEIVPGSYSRVVCIGAGALRLYSYIGDISLLCGVEDIDNTSLENRPKMFDRTARPYVLAFGDMFSTLPSCGVGGPNAQSAEAEKILSCNPDIVISGYEDADRENALQKQLGIPVITLRTGPDGVFDEAFRDSVLLLGKIFCCEEKADSLIRFVESETAEIASRANSVDDAERPGVYICGLGNWGTTNHLFTAQNYACFNVANIRNVVTDLGNDGIQSIEEEKFAALGDEIDIMIIDAAGIKNIAPLYLEDSTMFSTCRAWQNGDVYLQMAYNAYYTNYEIALINTWFIAKTVYPELFSDIDINEKANEITSLFLGTGLAEQIFSCPGCYGGYQKIDTEHFSLS